jgi:hypothetical protein
MAAKEPTNPELRHLMTRIRRDHDKHGLKVLYTATTLRIVDHAKHTLARVVLQNDQLLVGGGSNLNVDTYKRPAHVKQALHCVYNLAWPSRS